MPSHRSAALRYAVMICGTTLVLVTALAGQQASYMVAAANSISVYDLAHNSLLESIPLSSKAFAIANGPNPRLAFVSGNSYLSAVDLTLGREIKRIQNVSASGFGAPLTFTRDGRYLLAADWDRGMLDVIDAAALQLVRQVNLVPAMGEGAFNAASVVVVGTKAFVTTGSTDAVSPAIAVVDLNTFMATPIAIPAGFDDGFMNSPDAAATPDGKFVVMTQTYYDFSFHLLFISPLTNRVVMDKTIANDPIGIVITPVVNPALQYGYVMGADSIGNTAATVLDLRPGSRTYGQLLGSTEVSLSGYFPSVFSMGGDAITSDGSRLVVGGFSSNPGGPQTNAVLIDTALMLTDPTHAVVGQITAGGGAAAYGTATASITTTPPPTAPTVTGVSGNVTNNAATTIHVFGTNFASGAQVRIGKMAPLSATVNSSTDLQVTVPVNAPAAPNLDVVVTNTNTTSPPSQQNQSGLLARGMTIFVNPAFQPAYQLAVSDGFLGDGAVWVYDYGQRAMVQIPLDPPMLSRAIFNLDGAELYAPTRGHRYYLRTPGALALKLATDTLEAVIQTPDTFRPGIYSSVAASVNPLTGSPVVYEWTTGTSSGSFDLAVNVIDSNPSSPTFNTVIRTLYAGLTAADGLIAYAGAATSNGRYVYVNYNDINTNQWAIAIFDIVNGGPATIFSTDSLGVFPTQFDMFITADNQSLLLNATATSLGSIGVFDIGANPLHPTPVTTIQGPLTHAFLFSYQVVGSRLFAIDLQHNLLAAFNFDRVHSNFSLLAARLIPGDLSNSFLGVSPDGALVYVPVGNDDVVSVFDANQLINGQQALLTDLASIGEPTSAAVNPVHH